MSNNNLIIW